MKNTISLGFLFLFFTTTLLAQKQTSYYIRLSGDTVFCQLRYNNSLGTPQSVIVTEEGVEYEYKVAELKGFGIQNKIHFRRRPAVFHTNTINFSKAPSDFSDEMQSGDFLMQVIEEGAITLYELILPERVYYFIEENGAMPVELVYRIRLHQSEVKEDVTYKTQLNQLLEKYQLLVIDQKRTVFLKYTKSQIASVIRFINTSKGDPQKSYSKRNSFWLAAGAGVSFSSFPEKFRSTLLDPPHFYSIPRSTVPSFGLFFGMKRGEEKLSLRPELYFLYRSINFDLVHIDTSRINSQIYNRKTEGISMVRREFLFGVNPVLYVKAGKDFDLFFKGGFTVLIALKNFPKLNSYLQRDQVDYVTGQAQVMAFTRSELQTYTKSVQPSGGAGVQWKRNRLEFTFIPAHELLLNNSLQQLRVGGMLVHYSFSIFK